MMNCHQVCYKHTTFEIKRIGFTAGLHRAALRLTLRVRALGANAFSGTVCDVMP